ncbi:hypothetical protein BH11BAC2_BH11BAC2_00620 [soil metagenome]
MAKSFQQCLKFQSYTEFRQFLPDDQRMIVDYLKEIVWSVLPDTCREKLAYNVPFFYGKKRICLIWPGAIPSGGIRDGVLFGFCQGNKLKDVNSYLTQGTNKQVYYKIYHSIYEIDQHALTLLLHEAVELDQSFQK